HPGVGQACDAEAARGAYRSFGTLPAEHTKPAIEDPRFGPLLDRHTEDAIGATLQTRGYQLRSSGDVDFLVAYRNDVQVEARIDAHPVSVGVGYGTVFSGVGIGTGWSGPSRATARKVRKGRLVIDVLEPTTRRLVWRGWTEDTLSPNGDPRKDIFAAVDRVLEQFPEAAPRCGAPGAPTRAARQARPTWPRPSSARWTGATTPTSTPRTPRRAGARGTRGRRTASSCWATPRCRRCCTIDAGASRGPTRCGWRGSPPGRSGSGSTRSCRH